MLFRSGYGNTGGTRNVFLGTSSGGGGTAGNNNVYLGHSAGLQGSGSGNILIGYRSGYFETGSEKLYIENSDNDSNNALIYGEFNNDIIKLNGTVNIRDVLKLKPRAADPPAAAEGDISYNSTTHKLMVYNGTAWQPCN